MLKDLFDTIADGLKAAICGSLLIAGAAAAVTFAYATLLTCWRLVGSLWAHLFSRPWP